MMTQKLFQMEVRTWMIPKSLRSQVLKVEQKVVEKGEVGQQSLLEDHEAGNTWRAEEQESRASWKKNRLL